MENENMVLNWSEENVELLITTRLNMEDQFCSGKKKKSFLWRIVLEEMNKVSKNDFNSNGIKRKFDNLKTTYNRIKLRNKSTGRDTTTWHFFHLFDNIYGTCHNIHPPQELLYSSLEESLILDNDVEENSPPRKKKRNEQLEFLEKEAKEDERRHAEYMKIENQKLRLEEQRISILQELVNFKENFVTDILRKKERKIIPKNKNYIKVIASYPNDTFKEHFRMEKTTFKKLKDVIKPFWRKNKFGPSINLETALYMTIWRLANGSTFRDTGDRFGVSKGAAFKYCIKTMKILYDIQYVYIKWPNNGHEQKKIMEDFQNMRKNPVLFVIGCVDGTHIPIKAPEKDKINYFNRKGYYSINVQAICDSSLRFIDIFVGMPGSCQDAHVWKKSPIGISLESQAKTITEDGYILGDSAYELSSYLITPYRDNEFLTRNQKQFNFFHSSTRVCIEQAFGLLKGKFRILKSIDVNKMKYIKLVIVSCFVLHNYIIENESDFILEKYTIEEQTDQTDDNNETVSDEAGVIKRNRLAALFDSS